MSPHFHIEAVNLDRLPSDVRSSLRNRVDLVETRLLCLPERVNRADCTRLGTDPRTVAVYMQRGCTFSLSRCVLFTGERCRTVVQFEANEGLLDRMSKNKRNVFPLVKSVSVYNSRIKHVFEHGH